jgi:hypothetical protein
MALDLDAFETWRAIGKEPELFAPIRAEAAKAARTVLVKMLKSKSLSLGQAAEMRKAIGKETFALLIDGMKDAEVKTLVTRFDKHNAEAKSGSAEWRRRHLIDLVRGEIEPAGKPVKKTGRKGGKAARSVPTFTSAGAVRKDRG